MKKILLGFVYAATIASACAATLENTALRISFAEAEEGFSVKRIENRLAGDAEIGRAHV